jgi:5'-nucleotidase
MIKKVIIHIDMDDVLCDYKGAYVVGVFEEPTRKYPQSKEGFFLSLEPIDGAIDGVKFLQKHFEVYIATRPSYMNAHCYTEKRLWIEKYLGIETCQNLGLTPNKNLLIGDYLIDDDPIWTKGFQGKHIIFGSKEYPNWNYVVEYFKNKYNVE